MSVWPEFYTHKPIDVYLRNLQKTYINNALKAFVATNEINRVSQGGGLLVYIDPEPTRNDVTALVRAQLVSFKKDVTSAIPIAKRITKINLQGLISKIDSGLKTKEAAPQFR